jgi:hypothetical protein
MLGSRDVMTFAISFDTRFMRGLFADILLIWRPAR